MNPLRDNPAARDVPEDCPKGSRQWVLWEGVRVPLVRDAGGVWRMRSRSRRFRVDLCLGTPSLTHAKARAREELAKGVGTSSTPASKGTIQQVADVYLATPKRTADSVATTNVSRLRTIVRTVHGKELKQVPISALTASLWTEYQRARLAAEKLPLEYSRRHRVNHSINAAVRAARCLTMRRMRPAYAAAGIQIPQDADIVTWLPEPILTKPQAQDPEMVDAWAALRDDDPALWVVIGLARFAGLRREEILQARGKWIVRSGDLVQVELRDRPEDGVQTKTGIPYLAPIINQDLAAYCLTVQQDDFLVRPDTTDRDRWIERTPQAWVRPFVGDVQKPLHRLRGLYATDLQARTRDAVAAALAGRRAAADALGHTSTDVTERHYLL